MMAPMAGSSGVSRRVRRRRSLRKPNISPNGASKRRPHASRAKSQWRTNRHPASCMTRAGCPWQGAEDLFELSLADANPARGGGEVGRLVIAWGMLERGVFGQPIDHVGAKG